MSKRRRSKTRQDGPANDYGRDERLFQLLDQIHKEKGMG